MNVNIITVGKLKERYWRDACDEYIKRLSAFGKINVYELPEHRLPDSPSQKEIDAALAKEATLMRPYISAKDCCNIAMCIEGKQYSSTELSNKLADFSVNGFSCANFLIGSSFGLDESIKQSCHMRLSMSKLTFPHQLARVMLLEQIYRAFSISANKKYHK